MACLYLLTLPWKQHIHQLNYKKTELCAVNLIVAIFGDQGIKGFREKGKLNTGIKSCIQPL